jgi:autotransporter-associated beta strand protein
MNRAITRRRATLLLTAGVLAHPPMARAATATWTGGDGSFGTFTQPNNWGGTLPANNGSASLVFGASNPHGYNPTLNGNFDAASLTFNSSALAYNIITNGSGFSGILTLESGGLTDSASNTETISGSTAVLLNATQLWNVASGTFTDSTPMNLSNSTLTVNTATTTATANFTGQLTGSNSDGLIKTGSGTLNLTGYASVLASMTLDAGTTQISSGSLSISGLTLLESPAVLNISGGSFIANLGLAGNGGSIKLTDPAGGTAMIIYDVSVSGNSTGANISGTGSVQKTGPGYEGLLGTNTFTGQVLVNGGTLEMASGTASAYNAAGGTLILDSSANASGTTGAGGILTGAGNFTNVTIDAGGTFAPGASYTGTSQNGSGGVITINSPSTVSTNANLTLNAPTYVNVPASTDQLTLGGTIIGNSSSLTSNGAGTLILSGLGSVSTLTSLSIQAGATQISGGVLQLTASTTPLLVQGGATLTITNGATVATPTSPLNIVDLVDGPAGTSLIVISSLAGYSGALDAGSLTVGNTSQGSLTVTLGADLSLNQNLIIGSANGSTGTFVLTNAGIATIADGLVAKSAGATGSVTVNGVNSDWTITGPGGLTIGGSSASTPGSVSITNSGSIYVNTAVTFAGPNSSMIINGGTLTTAYLKSSSAGYGAISLTDPAGGSAVTLNSGSSGTFTYSGSISGTGSIYKTGASNQVLSGNNTFTGEVQIEGGSLNMSSGAAYYYEVDSGSLLVGFAGLGTSVVNSGPGTTVTFGGPTVSGGYLEGLGTYNLSSVSTVSGTTIENGTTITPASDAYLRAVTNYGTIINPASTILTWYGGSNAGGNFNVSGTIFLYQWTSTGVSQVNAGGTIYGFNTNMVLGGGSETYVGTANAPGGSIILTGGATIELNGGLLANFGTITAAAVYVNYGGLATGTGNYSGGVVVNPGGTYMPGNYGSGSPAAMLGSPFAMIQPATNGSTSTTVPVTVTAGVQITVNPGSTLTLAGGLNSSGQTVTILGGGTTIVAPFSATSLNVSNGVLQISPSSSVLELSSLTVGTSSKLDLTSDAADISGGTLAAVTALAKLGFANGTWNGSGGISSSIAAANMKHLTAIGVIQNNQSGTALYNSSHQFLNTTPGAGDILAAYTYYGDTNLDGQVNSSDYTRVDNGYLAHLTGWFNGDFNYDGVINGSDYTLIDNAFNTQGAQLSSQIAGPNSTIASQIAAISAVPEPSGISLFIFGCSSLSRRRKRPVPQTNRIT